VTDPNATGVSFALASGLHPGRRLGSYRLVRELGEGAFAEVWLAVQEGEHGFRKKVALKLLKELSADRQAYESLLNEARLCGLLHHQRIVDVFGVSQVDGLTFVCMEYVKGTTLDEVLSRVTAAGMQVPLAVVLEIGIGLCEALDHAHNATDDLGDSLQIVHRDLKPGNVMLAPGVGVKVADFGLAKATTSRTRTVAGQVRGTPGYIAPEVWAGTRDFLPTVDLFAVGVVLWELATGRRLFDGSILEVMGQAMNGDPESEMDVLRRFRPELVPIVGRLLRRNPDRRTRTAWEVLVELREMHEEIGTPGALDVFLELVGVSGSRRLGDTSMKLARVDAAWTGLMELAGVGDGGYGGGRTSANDHMVASGPPPVIDEEDDWYDDPASSARETMAVSIPSDPGSDLWPASARGVLVQDPEDSLEVAPPRRWLPAVVLLGTAALALIWVGLLWTGPTEPEVSVGGEVAGPTEPAQVVQTPAPGEVDRGEPAKEADPWVDAAPTDAAGAPREDDAPTPEVASPAPREPAAPSRTEPVEAARPAPEEAAPSPAAVAEVPADGVSAPAPAAEESIAEATGEDPAPAVLPTTGCLVFQSRPVGADVLLDGVATGLLAGRGETATRAREPGTVEVSMASEGVVLARQSVQVEPGARTVVRCDLLSGGTCTVRAAPGSCD